MEKKNTILLTVIAVATLLVAVVGATFAYFATGGDVSANIPVGVNTASTAASFTATPGETGDATIDIMVDANEMQEAEANETTQSDITNIANNLTDTATLKLSLQSPDGKSSVCTYDLIYTWTGAKNTYDPTPGTDTTGDETQAYYTRTTYTEDGAAAQRVPKEFTIRASAAVANGDDKTTTTPASASETSDTATVAEGVTFSALQEHNFDEYLLKPKDVTVATEGGGTTTQTVNYIELLKGLKIENHTAGTPTEVTWTFTAKFYNYIKDQSIQMGKTFTGNISVDNVQC